MEEPEKIVKCEVLRTATDGILKHCPQVQRVVFRWLRDCYSWVYHETNLQLPFKRNMDITRKKLRARQNCWVIKKVNFINYSRISEKKAGKIKLSGKCSLNQFTSLIWTFNLFNSLISLCMVNDGFTSLYLSVSLTKREERTRRTKSFFTLTDSSSFIFSNFSAFRLFSSFPQWNHIDAPSGMDLCSMKENRNWNKEKNKQLLFD